ncbi:uncharacterized protein METZ01_LOCUS39881 [marine metagenome]|uniref:Uncharacterized protein n=1 Tax=marine metagenome TaxID=408172 RepID=A0A381RB02_9ZZZZ
MLDFLPYFREIFQAEPPHGLFPSFGQGGPVG